MLIACPTCATRYNIDPAIIGASGRKVRCSQCATVWVQTLPDDAGPAPDAAPVPDGIGPDDIGPDDIRSDDIRSDGIGSGGRTPADAAVGGAGPDPRPPATPRPADPRPADPPPSADGPARGPRRRAPARAATQPADYDYPDFDPDIEAEFDGSGSRGGYRHWWLLAVIGILLLGAAILLLKEQIVAVAPGSGGFYEIIGFEDHAPGDVWDVQTKIPQSLGDGSNRLVISGVITNTADEDLEVPTLEATLLNAAGDTLRTWEFTADSVIVLGGDRTTFRTEFSHESQPGDHVVITFVDD